MTGNSAAARCTVSWRQKLAVGRLEQRRDRHFIFGLDRPQMKCRHVIPLAAV
jgi:hypothetical protein